MAAIDSWLPWKVDAPSAPPSALKADQVPVELRTAW
jgi:hypothetical protein